MNDRTFRLIVWRRWWNWQWGSRRAGVGPLFRPFENGIWSRAKLSRFPHYKCMRTVAKKFFDLGYAGQPLICGKNEFPNCPKASNAFCQQFYRAGIDFAKLVIKPGHHCHCCDSCFHIWSHPNNIREKSDSTIWRAHACSECGRSGQTEIFETSVTQVARWLRL